MGRRGRQKKHLYRARARKKIMKEIKEVAKTCRYVLSCALFGLSHTQANKFMLFNNHEVPNKTDFYIIQKQLIEKVHCFVQKKKKKLKSYINQ